MVHRMIAVTVSLLMVVIFCLGAAPIPSTSAGADIHPFPVVFPAAPDTPQAPQVILATAIDAGYNHSCLIKDNQVFCWGYNESGQLGDGGYSNSLRPVRVVGLSEGAVAISAGANHTCAVTTLGAAKCWGDGGGGKLGDGKWQSSTRPVTVSGLSSGVVDISAGDHHTCAVLNTGAARCWGYGGHGELGDGLASGSGVPVTPVGLTANVVQIGAGEQHTCARMNGGGIKCWGDNYWGQLATGNQTWSSVPVNTVAMGGSAAQLTVGGNGNCILTAGGGVQCWGIRSLVGDGTDVCYNGVPPNGDPWITRPRWIKNMTSFVTDVSAGYGHACAVQSGGVWCWGDGRNGQLGNGQTPPLETCTPVGVTGLGAGVARVSVGKSHTIALLSGSAQAAGAMEDDLGVRAWGANNLGQLGDGTTNTAMTPVQVVPPRFYTRLPVVLR